MTARPETFQELGAAFDALPGERNAAARGHAFERLALRMLEAHGYEVDRRPHTAAPRETDLFAARDDEYLVEARYRAKPAGSDAIDGLRARLERTASDVVGLYFSKSGFTAPALAEAADRRTRLILLVDGDELRRLSHGEVQLSALLRRKKRALIRDGRVLVGNHSSSSDRRLESERVPEPHSRFASSTAGAVEWITARGGFGVPIFVDELPDVEWTTAQGRGVGFDLSLPIESEAELLSLFENLRRFGWISGAGRFAIHQLKASWHGFGLIPFSAALRARDLRYIGIPRPHHSEEAIYFDMCPGGMYTLKLDLAANQPGLRVWRADLSSQIAGVPIDTAPYRNLVATYDLDDEAYFRSLADEFSRVRGFGVDANARLRVLDLIVSTAEPGVVRGLVVKNPFYGRRRRSVGEDRYADLRETDTLVCRLSSWHDISQPPDWYFLKRIEKVATADAIVYRVSADWHAIERSRTLTTTRGPISPAPPRHREGRSTRAPS